MLAASKSLRSLKNVETGLDVSIPSVFEVEAPLGGTTVEYEISIFTNLRDFKSHYHKEDDVIHYSMQRAYREIEDFCDKVEKKFKDCCLPSIPKGRDGLKYSSEEKRVALDSFMQHISKYKEICQSHLFSNFIGLNKLKTQKAPVSSSAADATDGVSSKLSDDNFSTNPETCAIANSEDFVSNHTKPADLDDTSISELFPKVKVRKASKPECTANEWRNSSDADSSLFSGAMKPLSGQNEDDLDLFEEAKKSPKAVNKIGELFDSDKKSPDVLFEVFDDSEKLFSNLSVESNGSLQKNMKSMEVKGSSQNISNRGLKQQREVKNDFSLFDKALSSGREEASIASKKYPAQLSMNTEIPTQDEEMKTTGVQLFEEQDFGTAITEEDEKLFFVAKQEHTAAQNPFLSPSSDDTDDGGAVESLEDLMNLSDPSITLINQKSPSSPPPEKNEQLVPKKPPVTLPRKKPQVAPKPSVPLKPSLPPKPKIAKKPVIKDAAESNKAVEKTEAVPSVSLNESKKRGGKVADDLTSFDIMKYIEEEEKAAGEGPSLFD